MTTNFLQRSAKRIAAGLACVALLSQVVPTVGAAVADKYSSDDNAGNTVLIIGGVGVITYALTTHPAPKKP
ncbi:hypothetical protein CCAX7_51730 [Capsulimonas corticalis]|uniref:Uncharacterized protein n=1 Tax=Capsulimonas corticalis TaxID=2219043 RepID=A0A402CP09_9BACT|nr:hypothetical protein [Capsulimonas corticalis]BDI33122.1 hypothetical protein CCAX7_51730 [Capsulimonas corticalis]